MGLGSKGGGSGSVEAEWAGVKLSRVLGATCRLTAAQESPGLEDWRAGGPSRLLQAEKRSLTVMLCVSPAPHLQA